MPKLSVKELLNSLINKSNLSKISIFTISFALSQAIMIAYSLVLARHLGPELYGYYATGYSLVGLWSFFISAGMDTWFLQRGRDIEQIRRLSGEIIKAKMMIFIIWASVLIIAINQINFIALEFIIICVLDIWCDSLLITQIYGLNIQQKYHKVAGIMTASRLSRLLSALVLIGLGARNPTLFALFRFFFTLIGFFIALITLKPKVSLNKIEITKIPYKELLPFGLSEMFAQLYIMADISLLALLAGKIQVGLYSPATNILSALFIIPNSLYLYLLPRFSKKKSFQGQIPDNEIILTIIGFGLVGLILFGGIALSSKWIIPIFLGKAFEQTKQLLLYLSPIIVLKSVQFGLIVIIVSSGLQKFRLIPQFIAAVLNVTMNVILIPYFGAGGAVLAYNVSELVLLLGYGYLVVTSKKQ